MKKLHTILLASAALVAGCTNQLDTIVPADQTRNVTIRLVADQATKTTLTADGTGLDWTAGDRIAYFIGEGTVKFADVNAEGVFTVEAPDANTTIKVVYPASSDDATLTYASYPKSVTTAQTQTALGTFDGANMPLTGEGEILADATTGTVTYSVVNAAILSFNLKSTSYGTETLASLSVKADGNDYTVALTGTIAGATDATAYVVIPAKKYTTLYTSLITDAATYRCNTDLTQKFPGGGVMGAEINSSSHHQFNLNLDAATVTRTVNSGEVEKDGLMVKVGDGEWQSWDQTADGKRIGNYVTKSTCPAGATTTIQIGNYGSSTMVQTQVMALNMAISNLDESTRIALDMSDVKAASGEEILRSAFNQMGFVAMQLVSFVFPNDMSNITSLYWTFKGCANLTTVSAIPANITDLTRVFAGCSSLSGTLTLLCTNTSITGLNANSFYGVAAGNIDLMLSSNLYSSATGNTWQTLTWKSISQVK